MPKPRALNLPKKCLAKIYRAVFSDGTVFARQSLSERIYTHAWIVKWAGGDERGFAASLDLAASSSKVVAKRMAHRGLKVTFQEIIPVNIK